MLAPAQIDRLIQSRLQQQAEPAPLVQPLAWHVVRRVRRSPIDIGAYAARLGWQWFQPMCKELRVVPKRKLPPSQRHSALPIRKPVDVPLFAGYDFIRCQIGCPGWRDALDRLGVQGLICADGSGKPQPARVADAVVDALMQREDGGAIPYGFTVRELAYAIGERVRIAGGAFAGQNAMVESVPDKPLGQLDEADRIRLLVSLFGRQTVVELSLIDIEKL